MSAITCRAAGCSDGQIHVRRAAGLRGGRADRADLCVIRTEQQAAVTVRYMHAEQQAGSRAVEPLRLTCASSDTDSAAAATASIDVSSASFVASTRFLAAITAFDEASKLVAPQSGQCCTN